MQQQILCDELETMNVDNDEQVLIFYFYSSNYIPKEKKNSVVNQDLLIGSSFMEQVDYLNINGKKNAFWRILP